MRKVIDLNPEVGEEDKCTFYATVNLTIFKDVSVEVYEDDDVDFESTTDVTVITHNMYPGTSQDWLHSISKRLTKHLWDKDVIYEVIDEDNEYIELIDHAKLAAL